MKKALVLGTITAIMTLSLGMTAFAAQWREDGNGWWWDADDGTYPTSQWMWIDGNGDGTSECYCFDAAGYCYLDTKTPDGYDVNRSGAWIVDGVVQTVSTALDLQAREASDDLLSMTGSFRTEIRLNVPDKDWEDYSGDELFQAMLRNQKKYDYAVDIHAGDQVVTCYLYDAKGVVKYTTSNFPELIHAALNQTTLSLSGQFFDLGDGTVAFKMSSYQF